MALFETLNIIKILLIDLQAVIEYSSTSTRSLLDHGREVAPAVVVNVVPFHTA